VFDRTLYTMIGCKERSAATPFAWENSFEIGRITENKNLILVVDDNTDCREILVMTLRILGYPVISAVDGAEALELAIACRPKLIFMDLSMPNMDGYDASRAIHGHAETRGIPIVALSANGNETKQRSKALDAGCIECWVKPFRMELILELLERRLSHAA
jgi:CheY-like chemotaxis protein